MFSVPEISVAPMLDWTDRHCRYFHRLLAPSITLYTEMIHTGAVLSQNQNRLLAFSEEEHPLVLQLGGSDSSDIAESAKVAAEMGYDAINLNVGCPSERVQKGSFGACMMAEPEVIADCVFQAKKNINIPITVKTRIGIDNQDSYEFLKRFISIVSEAGCETFIIHARKAWLKGLSPKENREIPPLDYDRVRQLKRDFPYLNIHINGGVKTLEQVEVLAKEFDGVMIGREAYQNPFFLAEIECALFGREKPTRTQIISKYLHYVDEQQKEGVALKHLVRPILGLFQGKHGARSWRRTLSESSRGLGSNSDVIKEALDLVRE